MRVPIAPCHASTYARGRMIQCSHIHFIDIRLATAYPLCLFRVSYFLLSSVVVAWFKVHHVTSHHARTTCLLLHRPTSPLTTPSTSAHHAPPFLILLAELVTSFFATRSGGVMLGFGLVLGWWRLAGWLAVRYIPSILMLAVVCCSVVLSYRFLASDASHWLGGCTHSHLSLDNRHAMQLRRRIYKIYSNSSKFEIILNKKVPK